jgi:chemotaxis protein MotB
MARKKKESSEASQAWLVTFSDLVTLLLTFFVLLLSMASMDRSVLTKVTLFTQDLGFMQHKGKGRVPSRVKILTQLLERPWEVMEHQRRIKDLLFPDDVVPEEISRSTLEENVKVLEKPEGVALVLSDGLLFPPGGSELTDAARFVLEQIGLVIAYTEAPVNVSGHTDDTAGGAIDNYELSQLRALAVLGFFLKQGIRPERCTASAYGPHWPAAGNDTPEGRAANRRVEILLKTTPFVGGYTL